MKRFVWIVIILVSPVVLLVLTFVGTELNKAYWDRQVRNLCEEEGGVTVYETVTLTEEEFLNFGGVKGKPLTVPVIGSSRSNKNPEFPYEMEWKITDIKQSYPYVWKSEMIIYRKSDKKILGEYITFSRRGGDFPTGIAHDSSFGCSRIEGFNGGAEEQIFIINGE